jgi:hypothetical protein
VIHTNAYISGLALEPSRPFNVDSAPPASPPKSAGGKPPKVGGSGVPALGPFVCRAIYKVRVSVGA